MLVSTKIILYGTDLSLLDTRRLILERSGLEVHATHELGDAMRLIEAREAELIVVCHSIPAEDAKNLMALAHATQPVMKTVVLIPANPTWIPGSADRVLVALEGPSALLAAVKVALEDD